MVKATVSHITMLGGRLYEGAINALVDERPGRFARGRDRGSLYLLVEITTATACTPASVAFT
jgi:hypothetical protein